MVSGEYKVTMVKINKSHVLPLCHFILTAHDVTKTNLLAIDSIVHRYVSIQEHAG